MCPAGQRTIDSKLGVVKPRRFFLSAGGGESPSARDLGVLAGQEVVPSTKRGDGGRQKLKTQDRPPGASEEDAGHRGEPRCWPNSSFAAQAIDWEMLTASAEPAVTPPVLFPEILAASLAEISGVRAFSFLRQCRRRSCHVQRVRSRRAARVAPRGSYTPELPNAQLTGRDLPPFRCWPTLPGREAGQSSDPATWREGTSWGGGSPCDSVETSGACFRNADAQPAHLVVIDQYAARPTDWQILYSGRNHPRAVNPVTLRLIDSTLACLPSRHGQRLRRRTPD
jgi:hypothetical protein